MEVTADPERSAIEIDLRSGRVALSGPLDLTVADLVAHLVVMAMDEWRPTEVTLRLEAPPALDPAALGPIQRLRDVCASQGKRFIIEQPAANIADAAGRSRH
ncbi:MAG: hypothetical protein HYX34_08150 [Actinobacteria bacterium]|nr:hypothetical protein [Actinomycetota bacterium]